MIEFNSVPLIITSLILSFNVGFIMDGLFLRRGKKETALTPLGWIYFGLLSLIPNLFILFINCVKKKDKKRKHKIKYLNQL